MLIIGTHFFTWGWVMRANSLRCGHCGFEGRFVTKKGMRFLTIFFVIPVVPLSGVMQLVECPKCRTRYQYAPATSASASQQEPQIATPSSFRFVTSHRNMGCLSASG